MIALHLRVGINEYNQFIPKNGLSTPFFGTFLFHWLQIGYIGQIICSHQLFDMKSSSCLATSACLFGYR